MSETLVCLVPKTLQPELPDQFRPIALCTVICKVVTKIIASRAISDNVLIAHELFHYINKMKKGKRKLVALKLEMKKAYDKLEWPFIKHMFLKMGFSTHWVNMVMACVSSVSYHILINGAPRGTVIPSQVIRQGDPLSPTLFILCSHALSCLLIKAEATWTIKGIRVRNRAPPITHLLFADDSLLFAEGKIDELYTLKTCLATYCQASGQEINLKKSCMTFSPNTRPRIKRWFSRVMKVPYGSGPKKYLGLPIDFGVSKATLFQDLSNKVRQRVEGWKSMLLSHAGKEVLLKSVVTSPNPNLPWLRKVADLIDQATHTWHSDVLSAYFNDADVGRIMNINLSIFDRPNKLVRVASKNGVFSVCIAYHLLSNKETAHRLTFSTSSRLHSWSTIPSTVWKSIWNSQTLPKVQRFLWRACAHGLATGDALVRRNVHADPLCVRCGECETISHILLGCSYARAVWFGSPLGSNYLLNANLEFSNWIAAWKSFSSLGKKESKSLITLCSFFCWHLWLSRNDLVFGRKTWQPNEVITAALRAFHEYRVVHMAGLSTPATPIASPPQWLALVAGTVKCNCDVSFSASLAKAGVSFVCRDHNGLPLKAVSCPSSFSDILIGEALAVQLVMQEMVANGYERVVIESDSMSLITYIENGGGVTPFHVKTLVDDIIYLSLSFVSFVFLIASMSFVCRDHNGLPLKAVSCPSSFSDILIGEALAVQLVMQEMVANGYERVVIESDSMSLITYIENGGGATPFHVQTLVDDIIYLSLSFVSCTFVCISREITSVTYSLVRRALSLTCIPEWPLSFP
ncbi:uncharacterized protein LOC122650608 [Telopea speciosissima]|uniref:uncharacterized protein LOC122650608 n=1 Tax=Telopea speciosissima TaxID=54955 RepID=UPI001CC4A300|nr:uncharacterized protein LOC122650608 [Telopea speciosissima]